jgi:hypothetical protein
MLSHKNPEGCNGLKSVARVHATVQNISFIGDGIKDFLAKCLQKAFFVIFPMYKT